MPEKIVRRQVYVNPFEGITDSAITLSKKKYSLKVNCRVVEPKAGCLKDVQRVATLILDGHGLRANPQIICAGGEGEGNQATELDVTEVCALLISCGLPNDHCKIRMLACHGAGFARLLAMEMGKNGYNAIVVAGYLGNVTTSFEDGTGRGATPHRMQRVR